MLKTTNKKYPFLQTSLKYITYIWNKSKTSYEAFSIKAILEWFKQINFNSTHPGDGFELLKNPVW